MKSKEILVGDYPFKDVKVGDTLLVRGEKTEYFIVQIHKEKLQVKIKYDGTIDTGWYYINVFTNIIPLNVNWKKILEGNKWKTKKYL